MIENKCLLASVIVAVSTSLAAPLVHTESEVPGSELDRITPFASLSWNDGIMAGIEHVRAIPGVSVIVLKCGHNSAPEMDIAKISTVGELGDKLDDTCTEDDVDKFTNTDTGEDTTVKISDDFTSELEIEQYVDATKSIRTYLRSRGESPVVTVTAGPINISNILFGIVLDFYAAPGLSLARSDAVVRSKKRGLSWPLVLGDVSLTTIQKGIAVDATKGLQDLLDQKYGRFVSHNRGAGQNLSGFNWSDGGGRFGDEQVARDAYGGALSVRWSQQSYLIEYSNHKYIAELRTMYESHRGTLNEDRARQVKDASSDL